jgi:hypothetical protein
MHLQYFPFTVFRTDRKKTNGYQTIMGPHGDGNRNSERENWQDMCNRNDWVMVNNWFQKKRSHKVTLYSWNGSVGTATDYLILTRNLLNILNNVKIISSLRLEDHRILIVDFRKVAVWRPTVYHEKKLKYIYIEKDR